MSGSWPIIAVCGYLGLLIVYGNLTLVLKRRRQRRESNSRELPTRAVAQGPALLRWQSMLLVLLLLFGTAGSVTLADLGVSTRTLPLIAFIGGAACYLAFSLAFNLSARLTGTYDILCDASFLALRSFWPRERRGKLQAVIAVCLLNPFTEEVMYRGVLTYALGAQLENFLLAAALSFCLSLAAHLYQGRVAIASQVIFHGIALALLFSPLGLLGSIGFHVAGDVIPVLGMKSGMRDWAARRSYRIKCVGPNQPAPETA